MVTQWNVWGRVFVSTLGPVHSAMWVAKLVYLVMATSAAMTSDCRPSLEIFCFVCCCTLVVCEVHVTFVALPGCFVAVRSRVSSTLSLCVTGCCTCVYCMPMPPLLPMCLCILPTVRILWSRAKGPANVLLVCPDGLCIWDLPGSLMRHARGVPVVLARCGDVIYDRQPKIRPGVRCRVFNTCNVTHCEPI